MRKREQGSTLIIAVIVVTVLAVVAVGMVRFTQRETAGAMAGQRADALSACAAAAQNLLASQFHVLGNDPLSLTVLKVNLDGTEGRQVAVGGHIGVDPTLPIATVKQVEMIPLSSTVDLGSISDVTNFGSARGMSALRNYKVTVHCQMGDTSSPTSGRQLEIEYAVRYGL